MSTDDADTDAKAESPPLEKRDLDGVVEPAPMLVPELVPEPVGLLDPTTMIDFGTPPKRPQSSRGISTSTPSSPLDMARDNGSPRGCLSQLVTRFTPRSHFYRVIMPLIKERSLGLTPFQRRYLKTTYVALVTHLEDRAMAAQKRFSLFRRLWIVGGVIVAALITLREVSWIQTDPLAEVVLFWVLLGCSLGHTLVGSLTTDLQLMEKAVLYHRSSTQLRSLGMSYLTLTGPYAEYPNHGDAVFRAFASDIENVRKSVMLDEVSLIEGPNAKKDGKSD